MTSFLSYQGSLGSKSKIALVGDGEYGVSITIFIQSLSMCNIPNSKARISFLIIFFLISCIFGINFNWIL